MPIFKFACNWAVSKKIVTGFTQIFVCEIRIYLFSSYLRFKSLKIILGINIYKIPLNALKSTLKLQIKALYFLLSL
jgi:hypothetical protein